MTRSWHSPSAPTRKRRPGGVLSRAVPSPFRLLTGSWLIAMAASLGRANEDAVMWMRPSFA